MTVLGYRRWRPPPNVAGDGDPFFEPELEPALELREGEPVFTLGSCFARNVEAFLARRFRVPSRVPPDDVPAAIAAIAPALTANRVVWHRYNAFSIRNSLEWALEPEAMEGRARLMELGEGLCTDPYAGCRSVLAREDALRISAWIDAIVASARECRVAIITLGLAEVWEDRESGLVMNASPLREMWTLHPDRFRFRLAGFGETVAELEAVHALLSRHCPDGLQIVATVSPIPLAATFREVDVVIANAASKAVLRAAVDEFARAHENVHYFPSYEMILGSRPEQTWMEDARHCEIDVIRRVMDAFLSRFIVVEPG